MLKKLIKFILPNSVVVWAKNFYTSSYSLKSYSQEGEDLVLKRLFEGRDEEKGFYVDVGAHHPFRFSNTYMFYKSGWNGINIDPLPGTKKVFDKYRSKDINLECGVSEREGELCYYMFNEPALNSFDKELSEKRAQEDGQYNIIDKKTIKVHPLKDVLDKHLPPNVHIDFLSIDVEGKDFEVLKSNDWDKYKPKVILVETLKNNLCDTVNSEITKFLGSKEYFPYAKTINTVFYVLK